MSWLQRRIPRLAAQLHVNRYSTSSTPSHPPLRILFCGSDDFSIHSLLALDALRRSSPSTIEYVDVLCRNDKRTGRGLKRITPVPIKAVSQELGLRLHQLDSFEHETPWSGIDLLITASFGLLVPARVLDATTYGGLNVHPSLLPQFRGAAPIQHAIMQRVETTGVSVQTMHPTKFDHGTVMAQQQVALQEPSSSSQVRYVDLVNRLGAIGGALLVDSIRHGLFIEPDSAASFTQRPTSRAPKITKADRTIDWKTWTADDLIARDAALSVLQDSTPWPQPDGTVLNEQMKYSGPWYRLPGNGYEYAATPGTPVLYDTTTVAWTTVDGALVTPAAATRANKPKNEALQALHRRLQSIRDQPSDSGSSSSRVS